LDGHIIAEAARSKLSFGLREPVQVGRVNDHVDVKGLSRTFDSRVGNQNASHHATKEDNTFPQLTELPCHR